MADTIHAATVAVPANTPIATPITVVLPMAEEVVTGIEIVIPDGHVGLTGIAIYYGPQAVIPYDVGQWIIANNDVIKWPVEGFPTGATWAAKAYNTDIFAHNFYVRILTIVLHQPLPSFGLPATITPGISSVAIA